MRFSCLCLIVAISTTIIGGSSGAHEYDALVDHSLGMDALSYEHSNDLKLQLDSVLIDGEVKTLPVNSINYDRTASTYARIIATTPFSPRLGSRFSLWAKMSYRKIEGDSEPRKIVDEQWIEGLARAELVFFTQTKIEIFFGLSYYGVNSFDRTSASPSVETNWEYEKVFFPVTHVGLVKRTGFVSGGFYYKPGGQRGRDISKTTSQDDSEIVFSDTVHDPTTVGFFIGLPIGKGGFTGEFASIQGSEGGNKTDEGRTLTEDYTRYRGNYIVPLGAVTTRIGIVHRSYSYSENRSVTLERIPMTALHMKVLLGSDRSNMFVGLIYGYGRDGQSLTEFNAEYKVEAFGLSAGFNYTL